MNTKHIPQAHKLSSTDKRKIVWTLLIVLLGASGLGSLAVHLTTQLV